MHVRYGSDGCMSDSSVIFLRPFSFALTFPPFAVVSIACVAPVPLSIPLFAGTVAIVPVRIAVRRAVAVPVQRDAAPIGEVVPRGATEPEAVDLPKAIL